MASNWVGETIVASGLLATLGEEPLDPMLSLMQMLRNDPRPDTIDLGVGVYRDATGHTPVMQAVKQTEQHLVATQASKDYGRPEGDPDFLKGIASILFGSDGAHDPCLTGIQTPGGTGALRLAAGLILKANPEARIWLGVPTWSNHPSIMASAGLPVMEYGFFDAARQTVTFDIMMRDLEQARAGDAILLHGCCHNPSGADLSDAQWQAIGDLILRKQLLPLIDIAYQGFGHGLDEDAQALRDLVDRVPEALIASSCSKNFGLYRDRIGSLWLKAESPDAARRARIHLIVMAKSLWMMPPDHGAAVVGTILGSAELSALWRAELDDNRQRVRATRNELAARLPHLGAVARQNGMFSLLPMGRDAVGRLRDDHGIYMLETGRINVAGLQGDAVARFAAAIEPYLT